MSVGEHRRAGCTGKQRFGNPQSAHDAVRKQRSRKSRRCGSRTPRNKGKLIVYHCAFCGGWHYGASLGLDKAGGKP